MAATAGSMRSKLDWKFQVCRVGKVACILLLQEQLHTAVTNGAARTAVGVKTYVAVCQIDPTLNSNTFSHTLILSVSAQSTLNVATSIAIISQLVRTSSIATRTCKKWIPDHKLGWVALFITRAIKLVNSRFWLSYCLCVLRTYDWHGTPQLNKVVLLTRCTPKRTSQMLKARRYRSGPTTTWSC